MTLPFMKSLGSTSRLSAVGNLDAAYVPMAVRQPAHVFRDLDVEDDATVIHRGHAARRVMRCFSPQAGGAGVAELGHEVGSLNGVRGCRRRCH